MLQYGIPLVYLPFGADQPTLAQRVEQLGAGIALNGEQALSVRVGNVKDLLFTLKTTDSYGFKGVYFIFIVW